MILFNLTDGSLIEIQNAIGDGFYYARSFNVIDEVFSNQITDLKSEKINYLDLYYTIIVTLMSRREKNETFVLFISNQFLPNK